MLPELPTITLPAIDLEWFLKALVYIILFGFVIFTGFMWREVVLGSRVLTTKATPLARFMAAFLFFMVLGLGAVVVVLLW